MEGTTAIYLGRIVNKENFRTFIYDSSNNKKLVNSWNEFESHMGSGLWFSEPVPEKIPEITNRVDTEETKTKRGRKKKEENLSLVEKLSEQINPLNTSDVFEVTEN